MNTLIFGPAAYTVVTPQGVQSFKFVPASIIERKAAKLDLPDKLRASVAEA